MGRGQILDTSSSEGLSVKEYWAMLFRRNEVWFRQGDRAKVQTDQELTISIRAAFPFRDSAYWVRVSRVRAAYNRGALTGNRPVMASYRYVRRDDGSVVRVTSRGHELPTDT